MRTRATVLCLMAAMASTALADDITVGKLVYSGVTIVDVKEGVVSFQIPNGRTQSKPLSDITSISITGLDSFNQAEKLMSETAGGSQTEKLRKEIETRKDEIAKIDEQVSDVPKETARLEAEAKQFKQQADADRKRAEALTKERAKLRKDAANSQSRAARLKREAAKLDAQAQAVERTRRKDAKAKADQLRKQADELLKKVAEADVPQIKAEAAKKLTEARRLISEARRIARVKKGDWKKQVEDRKKKAEKLANEAKSLDNKAKRITEENSKARTRIARLATDIARLNRQENVSSRKAAALESQGKAFPATAKKLKARRATLEIEIKELSEKLEKAAAGPDVRPGQFAAAIRAYETAAGSKASAKVKTIIDFRLLHAYSRAGWIDQAAALWLKLADREKTASAVVACRPNKLAGKGDPRNAKAINALGTRVLGIKNKDYHTAALELLVRLLYVEGRINEITRWLPKESPGEPPKLKLLRGVALLYGKEYAKAATTITNVLRKLDSESLPEAMSIRAKALLGQSDSEIDKAKKQELMQKAGLDFMRIWAFFQDSPRAGESLFLAGKIMAALPEKPNTTAAARAYEAVVRNYPGTPIGRQASIALKTLEIRR